MWVSIINIEPVFKDNMWGVTKLRTEFGKNVLWYVVDCEPGAYLYC